MSGKVYSDAKAALAGVPFDGMTVMSGGFGLSGNPENLITALKDCGAKSVISPYIGGISASCFSPG